MRNASEDNFFRRIVTVLDPYSLQIEPEVRFRVKGKNIEARLQIKDRQKGETNIPELVAGKLGHAKIKTLTADNDKHFTMEESLSKIIIIGLFC